MRLRILLAVVAVLAGALAIAGALSYSLVQRAQINNDRTTILHEAATVRSIVAHHEKLLTNRSVSALLRRTSGVKESVVTVSGTGQVLKVLAPLTALRDRIDGHTLAAGKDISGTTGAQAFAAVPFLKLDTTVLGGSGSITLALLFARPISGSDASIYYFLLGGGIALLVAVAVIWVISRRISRRVVAASVAARQIAAGHLDARVERDERAYPELAGLDDAINTMAENLTRARDQEREFLLSISHDLRTPLTSIRGYAEAIREGAVAEPARAAAVVVAEATRLERLIRDLLDLAKLEARQFSLNAVRCDLADIVLAATDALRLAHESVGVALTVALPSAPVVVIADGDRVTQVLSNLVENALKFARSVVLVTLADHGARGVTLSVEDDGPGIDPMDRPHVFERLFTSKRRAARAGGSGLGLAIVAELTAAMGGHVQLTSPLGEGGGTRFVVELPLARPPGHPASSPVHPSAAPLKR